MEKTITSLQKEATANAAKKFDEKLLERLENENDLLSRQLETAENKSHRLKIKKEEIEEENKNLKIKIEEKEKSEREAAADVSQKLDQLTEKFTFELKDAEETIRSLHEQNSKNARYEKYFLWSPRK